MSKAVLKELRAMAKTLPKQYEPWEGSFIASGSALIAHGSTEEKHHPDKFYKHEPGQRLVNHYSRMKNAHRSGGWAAVNRYIDKVKSNAVG